MNLLRRNDLTQDPVRYRHTPPLTIRWAQPEDADALDLLAELDEAPIPPAPLMLGFVGGDLWAAVSVATGLAICDPFKRSADVARLLTERGRQLTVAEPRSRFARAAVGPEGPPPGSEGAPGSDRALIRL